ncbi:hypothetical protein ACHAXS_004852 [Conticribra weissflogii]
MTTLLAEVEPETGVTNPCPNDVICGRGGAALRHPGNLAYRKLVNLNKGLYATCLKAEKLRISKSIVSAIREVKGRFLEREDGKISTSLDEKDENGNPVTWRDIGDRRAIEKTSQALREGQPKLLKKLKEMSGDNNQVAVPTLGRIDSNVPPLKLNNVGPNMNQMNFQEHLQYGQPNRSASEGRASMMTISQNIVNNDPSHSMPIMDHNTSSASYNEHPRQHSHNTVSGDFGGPQLRREGSLEFHANSFRSYQQNNNGSFMNSGHNSNYHDSWAADPSPLYGGETVYTQEQIFSPANQQHLLSILADDKSQGHNNKTSNMNNRNSLASFTLPLDGTGKSSNNRDSLATFTMSMDGDDKALNNRNSLASFTMPMESNGKSSNNRDSLATFTMSMDGDGKALGNRNSLSSFSMPFDEGGKSSNPNNRTSLASLTVGSFGMDDRNGPNHRSSVQFSVPQRPNLAQIKSMTVGFGDSVRSVTSYMSDLSMLETHSLDSALDAFERESELSLLGEFDDGHWEKYANAVEDIHAGGEHVYDWTTTERPFQKKDPPRTSFAAKHPQPGPMDPTRHRRSILRGSLRYSHNAFPSATITESIDPGMIFTSTFDAKPGGVNSGTDISGLLMDRRKSQVAFDANTTNRMRASMRMSTSSLMNGKFMRDLGGSGFYSIQSVDIRELMDLSDDDDDDEKK